MKRHVVPEGVQPMELLRYLARAWPSIPGYVLRGVLSKKDVRVNGVRSGADARVGAGDELCIYLDERYFEHPLRVIHEDGRLLVVDKPVGIPVDADEGRIGADTVLTRMRAIYPDARLCHRLDTGTGGVLVAALDDETYQAALDAFARRDVKKTYHALVLGAPEPPERRLNGYLMKNGADALVRVMDRPVLGAKPIVTRYRVLEDAYRGLSDISLLEVSLETGRTHQIRAHLSHIGHPLLGDDKYGDRDANRRYGVKWPCLWCVELTILGGTYASEPEFPI